MVVLKKLFLYGFRVVFMLVIFAMALLLSMPKPNRAVALMPY